MAAVNHLLGRQLGLDAGVRILQAARRLGRSLADARADVPREPSPPEPFLPPDAVPNGGGEGSLR